MDTAVALPFGRCNATMNMSAQSLLSILWGTYPLQLLFFFNYFFFLAMPGLHCSTQDLYCGMQTLSCGM